MRNNKRIAVIAAHPDDEILGCGGTISRFAAEGSEVFILILGQGVASRHTAGYAVSKKIAELRRCGKRAASRVKAKVIDFLDFPDNRFDTVSLLDIIKAVEMSLDAIKPDTVFTHSACDLNVDHQITAQAVITATRPLSNTAVHNVYAFEVLSSSEWNFGRPFTPNVFIDISSHIEAKKKAMAEYVSEIRKHPHPRSLKSIEALASYRGSQAGFSYAEAFSLIRAIR